MIQVNDATAIRPMREQDYPFVVDSWLKTFQFGRNRRHVERASFARCHYPVVRLLLERSPRRVVACDPSADDNIQAWCLGDVRADRLPVVHYCFVREPFLGLGLERLLFSAVTGGAPKVVLSHLCKALDGNTGEVEVLFDPYSVLLREEPAQPAQQPEKRIIVP